MTQLLFTKWCALFTHEGTDDEASMDCKAPRSQRASWAYVEPILGLLLGHLGDLRWIIFGFILHSLC